MSSEVPAGIDAQVATVIPVLRMYDVEATKRFYVDYLGSTLDREEGDGDRPVYLHVSLGGVKLHLSSHHDDGTPGTVVLVVVRNLDAIHAALGQRGYPFLNPGIEDGPGQGRTMTLIDPASNRLRFYEPTPLT